MFPLKQVCAGLLLAVSVLASSAWADTFTIGVLAWHDEEHTDAQWQPMVSALSQALPQHQWVLRPLELNDIPPALMRQELDFLITNPGDYVEQEHFFGVSRIATYLNPPATDAMYAVGSTVIVLAARPELQRLEDLKGLRLAIPTEDAFGAFQILQGELRKDGLDIHRDIGRLVQTGYPLTKVVEAVREGRADAGVIRSCLLEQLVAEQKIPAHLFRVLSVRRDARLPCVVSSRLYPDWAFAAARQTSPEIARQVLLALLSAPPSQQVGYWSVPADYQPVHALLRELGKPPYAVATPPPYTFVRQYWPWLLAMVGGLLLWLGYTLRVERLVKYRTSQLQQMVVEYNAATQQANANQEQLEHLSRLSVLGELSGSLAHELSQPLASIGNYGSALVRASEQALLTPDVVAYAAREITAEATRASGVLDGIRRLAKKRPCVREVQAMIPLAVQTIALFTGLLRAAPAVALVESVPVFAQMDALQIQQVLLNLLKNARDAQRDSPAPVPPIEVRITATEGVITVSVRDHGTPLTDAELAKIFDPFFTTKQEGLGLGLSICRTIIEAHGGALTACRAEEGVGLILSFTLPQAPSAT